MGDIRTKNNVFSGIAGGQVIEASHVVGNSEIIFASEDRGERRRKLGEAAMVALQDLPLTISYPDLKRNIPTVFEVVRAENRITYDALKETIAELS